MRIQLDPLTLAARGIGVDEVERAVRAANAQTPAGALTRSDQKLIIEVSTQLGDAQAWRDLIIANPKGRPLRLGDVAKVINSVEDNQRASSAQWLTLRWFWRCSASPMRAQSKCWTGFGLSCLKSGKSSGITYLSPR